LSELPSSYPPAGLLARRAARRSSGGKSSHGASHMRYNHARTRACGPAAAPPPEGAIAKFAMFSPLMQICSHGKRRRVLSVITTPPPAVTLVRCASARARVSAGRSSTTRGQIASDRKHRRAKSFRAVRRRQSTPAEDARLTAASGRLQRAAETRTSPSLPEAKQLLASTLLADYLKVAVTQYTTSSDTTLKTGNLLRFNGDAKRPGVGSGVFEVASNDSRPLVPRELADAIDSYNLAHRRRFINFEEMPGGSSSGGGGAVARLQ
jgi:hypothetical protein